MYLTFELVRLFKDCPKPSGWFACRARMDDGSYCSVKGVTYMRLFPGIKYKAKLVREDDTPYGHEVDVRDVTVAPGRAAMVRYVAEATGSLSAATSLYDAFGDALPEALVSKPGKVRTLVGDDVLEELTDAFVVAAVGDLLAQGGGKVSREVVLEVVRRYGLGARDAIMEDPYRLLEDFPCSFRFGNVDAMALAVGVAPDDPRRVSACAWQGTRAATGKDVCLDVTDPAGFARVRQAVVSALSGNGCAAAFAGRLSDADIAGYMRGCGRLVLDVGADGRTYTYSASMARAEERGAAALSRMSRRPMGVVTDDNGLLSKSAMTKAMRYLRAFEKAFYPLDPSQRDAVRACLENRVSVLTGGPGVGKTSTLRALVYVWAKLSRRQVTLLAPTWQALKHMSAAVSEVSVGGLVLSMTVQSFVKVMEGKAVTPGQLVIVDETSMVEFSDGCKLLDKCADCDVVLVGDPDQLPSISAGDFLLDVMDALGRASRLTECHRANARVLKDNADAVNAGLATPLAVVPGTFELQPFAREDASMGDYLAARAMEYMADRGLGPDGVVVLCGMHKGAAGTDALNRAIRDMVVKQTMAVPSASTPDEEVYTGRGMELQDVASARSGCSFRVGDRVIALENRHGEYTNGDLGTIVSYKRSLTPGRNDKSEVVIARDGPDKALLTVPVDRFRSDFDLAYAVTVHKSQGCEWPVVLVSVQPGLSFTPGDFASRPLLYTAMTRGRDVVELVGSMDAVRRCASTPRDRRRSRLAERVAAMATP